MVEPVEDTRSELVFATEPLLSSLYLAIPGTGPSSAVELDEIEVGCIPRFIKQGRS
jgi:SCY1-like protein 2